MNLKAFAPLLWLKSSVEFVRKKLDNAIEIWCTLRLSRENMMVISQTNGTARLSRRAIQRKSQSSREGLNSIRPHL